MRWLACIGLFCALLAVGAPAADRGLAIAQFQQEFPDVSFYERGGRITRIYGPAFGFGDGPEQVAEEFRLKYAGVFGVAADDLRPVGPAQGGRHTQPVMYDPQTGTYKFTLVYYSQFKDGIPVYRAALRLLVRNEPGFPLVWVGSTLRDLGSFSGGRRVRALGAGRYRQAATELIPGLLNFTRPKRIVWAGVDDMVVAPALAVEFVGDNGLPATGDYQKWLFIADATTGRILYTEDLILNVDVVGNVSGYATEGWGADVCGPEVLTPMPYAEVSVVGGNSAYADQNGDFVIPHGGSGQVTVRSGVIGRWFDVNNYGGADTVLELDVVPPGPADFEHNGGGGQFTTAEVNGYVQANVVRDLVIYHNPDYPGLQQAKFPVNVNLNSNCNAYYDYSSINFFRAGSGCSNTAFSVVVHHEYGHHLVQMAGSGQGAYGEGMGDVMGVLISDDPILARGFYSNDCENGIRNADNNMQYPCDGEAHYCGMLISGSVWSTRTELLASYPDTYRDIIANLAINSMLLHTGSGIDPSITIDYLTLDDDDGNIENGTPHYYEIDAGFGAHNMGYPLNDVLFDYPDGLVDVVNPDGGTRMRVEVVANIKDPQPGTGKLHYSTGGGYTEIAMEEISDNVYDAVFPPIECGSALTYYVSVETTEGRVVTDPRDAPDSTYGAYSAYDLIVVMADDFETDQGWSVQNEGGLTSGAWERGVPANGNRSDPPSDFDGSGQCYLTENWAGDSDVDDGTTHLISPRLALAGTDPVVSYARWYANYYGNDPHNDIFVVSVSNDDGNTWVTAETVGPGGEETNGGWYTHGFVLSDFVVPTDQVRVRFTASDLSQGSVVEAAVDAFEVIVLDCTPPNQFVPNNAYAEPGKGDVLDGGVEKLAEEDGDLWRQRAQVQLVTIVLESLLVAETNVGPETYAAGQVRVVMNATPPRPEAAQYRVRAWDYTAGAWVTIGTGDMPADGSLTTLTLPLPGDVNDYIDAATRQMRVDVQNTTDRVAQGVLIHGIDLIRWELTP